MKFVRVMNGKVSHQSNLEFKINEVNIASNWNTGDNLKGFNFSNEENILRWLIRGDTIYDVELPPDAEVINVENKTTPNGIFRTNKIIVKNPRLVTDELALYLYKKSKMPEITYYKTLAILAIKGFKNTCFELIKDKINKENIDLVISEYKSFANGDNHISEAGLYYEILKVLEEIKSDLLISIISDKEPYIKELTDDKVINITGQSGAGKSTFSNRYKNDDNYLVIDTDEIFSKKRYEKTNGINKELGDYFRNKYKVLPNLLSDFDLIYSEIIDYCKRYDKILVIDCAQFHCVKDINILKGKIIIVRTSINTCYDRCIERFKRLYPNYTEEELENYKKRKHKIFEWYRGSNDFIITINSIKKAK